MTALFLIDETRYCGIAPYDGKIKVKSNPQYKYVKEKYLNYYLYLNNYAYVLLKLDRYK